MKKNEQVRNNNINYKLIIRLVLLPLVVFLVIEIYQLINYYPNIKNAVDLATTVKPETFTELYFENHTSLPSKIINKKNNAFKFTIHNLENKNMLYPYEVYTDTNGDKKTIQQSTIFIKNNGFKTIDENFTIVDSSASARIKVIINLINENQHIDFWIKG